MPKFEVSSTAEGSGVNLPRLTISDTSVEGGPSGTRNGKHLVISALILHLHVGSLYNLQHI